MELVQLLEYRYVGWGDVAETHTYEVYTCDMVKAITSSANAYWHDRKDMERLEITEENIVQTAKFWVTSDGGHIGAFETYEELLHFFKFYLRATLLTSVDTNY